MKKWMALMMLLCLLPCMGTAENNNPAKAAVVANQNVADRLILRSAPTKNGKVLGRFYSGTPVIILEDDGSWCRVQIGSLTGYMMRPYLADELPNYDLPQLFFDASVKKTNAPVYSKASTSSPVVARASDTIKLLGDINDDWRYVKCGEQYGYMRALHLYETEINLETAYLSSRVELCSDPGLKEHTGAIYYANTPVRVVAVSRKEGWAKVEITGFPGVSDGLGPSGYIRQEYLNVFVWPWQANDNTFSIGRLLQAMALPMPNAGAKALQTQAGTLVTIIGETQDAWHILHNDSQALVDKRLIAVESRLAASATGMETKGFVLLPPGDERLWYFPQTMRMVGQQGDELAVEYGHGNRSSLPGQGAVLLENNDLNKHLPPMPEGDFFITEESSAIWHFDVKTGETAVLSLENNVWNLHIDRQTLGPGSYSYFLPVGTTGTLLGASWSSEKGSTPDIRLYTCLADWAHEPAFTGSSRFFCDWQIRDNGTWYGYRAEPIPGCTESYFVITSLNTLENQGENGRKVNLLAPEHEEDIFFTPQPGEFVELHNCILFYDFGNG